MLNLNGGGKKVALAPRLTRLEEASPRREIMTKETMKVAVMAGVRQVEMTETKHEKP